MKARYLTLVGLLAIAGCGGSGGSGSAPPPTTKYNPTVYAASYGGTWSNQTDGTAGSVAIATAVNSVARTVAFTTTLTGKVFGGTAPAPFTLSGNYVTSGANFAKTVPNFGTVSATIDANGNFNGNVTKVPNAPKATVSFYGSINATQINVVFEQTSEGGVTTQGVANLTATSTAN